MGASIYDFSVATSSGEQSLADYKGKAVLIVNTASRCGYTPQYKGLQAIYEKYNKDGFEVLAFPCNQFGEQEPGDDTEIKSFCDMNYSITFPIFKKVDVNGKAAHPLYNYLKQQAPGLLGLKDIKWNFTKFLIDKNGKVVKRYAPMTEPSQIEDDIKKLL
ncbi:MAG: glutathione peroxidase [Leptospiraceae bacterium]|jgi:glutathione peroxidase|nr:glutathione peroxidase [Leptospiraceae bacterium]MCZ8347694.1 glutathione peroxidase [Leptospiraceae bacterium]PJE03993.1 MAG: glutathione peroxidase [Leptospira sp.]